MKRLWGASRFCLATLVLQPSLTIAPAFAQQADETRYALPGQSLAKTLRAIARIANCEILFRDADVQPIFES